MDIISWCLDEVTEHVDRFSMPCIVERDVDYYPRLKKDLEGYMEYINTLDFLDETIHKNIRANIELVLGSLCLYYDGRIGQAQDNIRKIIDKYNDNKIIVDSIDRSYAFRGMAYYSKYKGRMSEMRNFPLSFYRARKEKEDIDLQGILHIPFDKRGLITTERFSIAGIPCIYLGVTSYVCWKEIGQPKKDKFQVASFKLPNDLKVLNLCISWRRVLGAADCGNTDELMALLEIFPLVYATSFNVKEKINKKERAFKSEYIIPQLLMQVSQEKNIDGIAYLSKKMNDDKAYPLGVNLAVAIKAENQGPYTDEKYQDKYWARASDVKISQVIRMSDFIENHSGDEQKCKSYCNSIWTDSFNFKIKVGKIQKVYSETEYSKLDNYLLGLEHTSI